MILSRLLFKNSDPSAVVSKIEKSIGKLNRQKRFISYRESGNFAKSLHCLLDTVESNVLPKNPLDALWLFALFIETDSSVIGQADDSSGEIGECYHRACKLLGVASEAANQPPEVHDLFHRLISKCDYGTRDPLFDFAPQILSPTALKALIDQWKIRIKSESFDEYGGIRIRLAQVARSIGDGKLFEEVELCGRSPNDYPLVAFNVAECYLEIGNPEAALKVIPQINVDSHFVRQRNELLTRSYRDLGDTDKLREICWTQFENSSSPHDAQEYLEILAPDLQEDTKAKMREIILKNQSDPATKAYYFVQMNEYQIAEDTIIKHQNQFDGDHYSILLKIAKPLEKRHPLAATILYRANLNSILKRAISKYYRHALRYTKKLFKLAQKIDDWKGVQDHQNYWEEIEKQHARKPAFWRVINTAKL